MSKEDDKNMEEVYNCLHDFFIEDPTVVRVLRKYEKRSEQGMKDHGTTMAGNKEHLRFWLEQAMEEAMDFTLYCQRALEELDKEESDTVKTPFCKMFKWGMN